MFLEPRESHGLCPLWALVHLRAGALGSCELERPGQRGVERTPGHAEGRCPAEPGTRCGSGWQPGPRVPLCGKRGSLSGGGVQRPHRVLEILYVEVVEERRCQRKRSCVQAKSLRSGWALHSILGFQRRDDFESQLYSDHLLILGRPSYCLGSLAFSHVRWGQTHPVNV